jgi:murein DD-endopeptidase MepM/ murein hydrolase activator NlpD
LKLTKHNRNIRYFSLIFVPDQERDPKTVSMTYGKGKILLAVLILLGIHIITGAWGYARIINLENRKAELESRNLRLATENKKIEQVIQEFQVIRETDQKIRKAFGASLGISGSSAIDNEPSVPSARERIAPVIPRTWDASPSRSRGTSRPVPETSTVSDNLSPLLAKNNYYNPNWLPSQLPVGGILTTRFQKGGWFLGKSHQGIDIAAPKGTPILAAGAGQVLMADWTPDFGNVVLISHGNGLFTYYGHAMRLLVEQGFHVQKGQPIALLGSSGISSAPHLHFEIWKDGEPIDPEPIMVGLQKTEQVNGRSGT